MAIIHYSLSGWQIVIRKHDTAHLYVVNFLSLLGPSEWFLTSTITYWFRGLVNEIQQSQHFIPSQISIEKKKYIESQTIKKSS